MHITETVDVRTRRAWRRWLRKHHATMREIWLVYHKRVSGRSRIEYNDAVAEALCFGWIDTTVKTLDGHRYAQRFTPRRKGSNRSTPNLERAKRLAAAGLMTPAGAAHIPSAKAERTYRAKHQKRLAGTTVAPRDLAATLRTKAKALAHWKVLAPGYKRLYIRSIGDAKRPETRARRITDTVSRIARREKHPMA